MRTEPVRRALARLDLARSAATTEAAREAIHRLALRELARLSDRPRYTLIIEAQPDSVPVAIRLRGLLKAMLRCWGFKCVDLTETKDPMTQGQTIAHSTQDYVQ